jgi:hypothetical protein
MGPSLLAAPLIAAVVHKEASGVGGDDDQEREHDRSVALVRPTVERKERSRCGRSLQNPFN